MLQDMDHIEASCVFYVEVGRPNWLEQNKICVLTVNTLGIAMPTVHHDMIFSVCFIQDRRDSWDNQQQTSFPMKNVPFLTPNNDISAVIHHDLFLQTITQYQTDLVQFAWSLAICATGTNAQQDSSCVERASWLLHMPFWLEANDIFLRSPHFISLSSSSGLPTSFRYHHLFTSTGATYGSRNTSARWEWNRIKQNDGHFIQYATRCDPTTTQTPLCSPQYCKCSHQIYDPRCTVENCLWIPKQQEEDAACDRMSV